MSAEMFSYLEEVVFWLVSRRRQVRIKALSGTSVTVDILDSEQRVLVSLDEIQVRDILATMKRAKAAAKVADEVSPVARRGKDD